VIGARVHLVLPENDPRKPNAQPSSAAVLIKHNGDPLVGDLVPQIKELVTNSIEGLSYDKVTVVLFENRELGSEVAVHELHDIFGLRVDPSSVQELWVLIGALGTLMVATLGLAIAVILTGLRRRGQAEHGG
jgi:type III secretion protein J